MPFSFFGLPLLSILNSMLAQAHPESSLFSESIEPNLDNPADDPYLMPAEFTSDFADLALDPANQETADLFVGSNDPFTSTDLWDPALPSDSCPSEEEGMNGILRARDGASCSLRKDNVDLPVELFENPEGYLQDMLSSPPIGQGDRYDQGSIENGDLGFEDFLRNRRLSIVPLEPNDQICDHRIFGKSNVPMCDNPFTGSVASLPGKGYQFNLIDAFPCECIRLLL